MSVDVISEVLIHQPRERVAAFACDPDNATAWYENIKVVEWETPRPVVVGSRVAFQAAFLGRRLSYTYQVTEMVPGRLFVMRTAQGPFPMETTYQWQDAGEGVTRMLLLRARMLRNLLTSKGTS
jgi:ligand-binding SRPBCC domain-containing protein